MFEPVNDLEKSLMKAAANPAARPQFYRDLLEAEIFIIQSGADPLNVVDGVLQKGSHLNIYTIERDGKPWLPIFSSLPRLQRSISSESTYVRLKAKNFFELTRGAYVVLNPGFDYGKEFVPQEINQLLDGSIFNPTQTIVATKDTQVLIGQPAFYPQKLVSALSEYFSTSRPVKRVYLTQLFNPESGEQPHLLIAVDLSDDREKVFGDAGMIASNVVGKDEYVDFMQLDNSEFSKHIISSTTPFYKK
jgi:hypothetical protein